LRYVIDASAVLKSLLAETDSAPADALIASHRDGSSSLIAPDLLVAEVGNALWKRSAIRQQITAREARELFSDFLALGILVRPSTALAAAAINIALRERHPIYDCFYIALAEQASCAFVTADEKLRMKFKRHSIIGLSSFTT
jgi:predicted nucleic acid-binding protein